MSNTLIAILSVLAILNISVSIMIFRRNDLDKFQKITQSALVWLIPFVGAIGFWVFNKAQDAPYKPSKSTGTNSVDHYTVGGD